MALWKCSLFSLGDYTKTWWHNLVSIAWVSGFLVSQRIQRRGQTPDEMATWSNCSGCCGPAHLLMTWECGKGETGEMIAGDPSIGSAASHTHVPIHIGSTHVALANFYFVWVVEEGYLGPSWSGFFAGSFLAPRLWDAGRPELSGGR